ncbi:MAG TPA: hypothetical protein VFS39_15500 [Nitrospira sp.]|nr:hypothetical protein [Nitrospira sp.]
MTVAAENRRRSTRRPARSARRLSCFALGTLLSALSLLAGCAIPQTPYRIVYEDPVNYVRLEEDDSVLPEWPPGHHAHPKVFTTEQVTRILTGLTVREHRMWLQKWIQGEAPFVPALREEEVALLAPQIAEAFAMAKYNERVTFYLSQPQTSVKRVITTGGLYVHDNELHVILGNWQIVYGIPTYGMIYDRRYPMRPTAAKGFDLFFRPPEAVIKQQSSLWDTLLANNKDELVIDLDKVTAPEYAFSPH